MRDPAVKYQTVDDLRRRARRRTPRFAWEYLDSGEGDERSSARNTECLRRVLLTPQFLKGELAPDISTDLLGVQCSMPVGIAPVGLTGLIWPGADAALAETAARCRIPYAASTVNTADVSDVGPRAGDMGWFQLYPPRDLAVRQDLLHRAEEAGFRVLVVTADVPARARRERQTRQRVSMPPRITPSHVSQAARRPAWTLGLLRNGLPRFHTLEPYVDRATLRELAGFVGASLGGSLSWDYLAETCELWPGPVVVKGILHPDDAERCVDTGADAVEVSNHGGRQLDAAPASIEALGPIVDRIGGQVPVLFDGGIRSGLDIARALALGADFTFAGRAFMYGLCALGTGGAEFVAAMFEDQLTSVMHQLGCERLEELRNRDPRFSDAAARPVGLDDEVKRAFAALADEYAEVSARLFADDPHLSVDRLDDDQ